MSQLRVRSTINGEFDRPNARTTRMTREVENFTNVVLPSKSHLTAITAGYMPKEYLESQYLGAYHASEISYVFNNLNPQNSMLQEVDHKLAETMSNYWVNFAKTGDPNGKGLPKWAPYNASDEPYMDFGDVVQLRNHLLKGQLDFLEQF